MIISKTIRKRRKSINLFGDDGFIGKIVMAIGFV